MCNHLYSETGRLRNFTCNSNRTPDACIETIYICLYVCTSIFILFAMKCAISGLGANLYVVFARLAVVSVTYFTRVNPSANWIPKTSFQRLVGIHFFEEFLESGSHSSREAGNLLLLADREIREAGQTLIAPCSPDEYSKIFCDRSICEYFADLSRPRDDWRTWCLTSGSANGEKSLLRKNFRKFVYVCVCFRRIIHMYVGVLLNLVYLFRLLWNHIFIF